MPRTLTNYHTHSTFCDGNDTLQEIAKTAFEQNISILGFSSHAMYPFSSDWHIKIENYEKYVKEINELKSLYHNKMDILIGFEADYIPGITVPKFENYKQFNPDYLIGAVHFVGNQEAVFGIDESAEYVKDGIERLFNGDGKAVVCDYFLRERQMLQKGNFTILAHADLVRKRNNILNFFDENANWYKDELFLTAKEIAKAGVIVEINTGALSRKVMDDVYPSAEFLSMLNEYKVPITFSSDAHNKETLTAFFDRAENAAKNAGYTEICYLDKKGLRQFQSL